MSAVTNLGDGGLADPIRHILAEAVLTDQPAK
jgi:hypothetical protein